MPRSNVNCCVVNCHSTYANSPGTSFFRFPSKPYEAKRRERWIALVRQQNKDGAGWRPTPYTRICSKHFVGGVKVNEEGHPAYYPSIFPATYRAAPGPLSEDRYVRKRRRQEQRMLLDKQTAEVHGQAAEAAANVHEKSVEAIILEAQAASSDNSPVSSDSSQGALFDTSLRFVHVSTMTEDGHSSFSSVFTFTSELTDKYASCYISHNEVCTTGVGRCSTTFIDKSCGPLYKQPVFAGHSSVTEDEEKFHSLTAVSFNIFALLLSVLPPMRRAVNELRIEDKLLLFLIKLRHGMPFSLLGALFDVHRTTAARIFKGMLVNLNVATKSWVYWPSRNVIQSTMPPAFKEHYPSCRVIIDCTELETEIPNGVGKQNLWYSHYKSRHTIKYLIGIAPNGLVTFVSKAFGGRTTDSVATVESGFLSLLEPGDLVLADKGFSGIKTGVGTQKATLVLPPFASSQQFTESEVNATYETASVRIHVERVIQRLKIFDITHKIPCELTSYADAILHMIAIITNLKSPIFAKQ
ncbi:uncharacterized protein [Dermacentor albipictus]|uniref:uncharacterized protein n=1 Tax=Dermacentor albipictus TaxID=60249 RepID=UPI0038FCF0A1